MTQKSRRDSRALYGIAAGIVAITAMLFLTSSGAFGAFGNLSQVPTGTQICDIQGKVFGTVQDGGVFGKQVTDLVLNADSTNCHPKGILEANLFANSSPSLPSAALYSPGYTNIYVTIIDKKTGQIWDSDSFTVTTNIGEISKQFDHSFTFSKLVKGSQYEIRVTDSWDGSTVKIAKTVTA